MVIMSVLMPVIMTEGNRPEVLERLLLSNHWVVTVGAVTANYLPPIQKLILHL